MARGEIKMELGQNLVGDILVSKTVFLSFLFIANRSNITKMLLCCPYCFQMLGQNHRIIVILILK